MRQVRWMSWLSAVAMVAVLGGAGSASADVASDRAAAIVQFPLIESTLGASDTVIQLSNTSPDPVDVHCFYENANSHCTNDGSVCTTASECCKGQVCGVCQPGWNETDFRIRLTPRQPLGWVVSSGLSTFPIDGLVRTGVGGSSNAGSRIPAVPEDPFIGMLKCIVTDDTGTPIDWNVLKGEATLSAFTRPDVAKYNAVGIQAIAGAVNDDRELILGGPDAEYNGCPNVLVLNHFFDGVTDPVAGGTVSTDLVLTPCTQDLLRQIGGKTVVQYLVYNEFEQRFSTSRTVDCQQDLPLSKIDTPDPTRSIFSAGVSGTVTGQTRLSAIDQGVIGVALETHSNAGSAAFNIHFQGDRPEADTITLP